MQNNRKTVAVVSNDHAWTYNLRREILQAFLDAGTRVVVIVGYGSRVDDLVEMGCEFIDVPVDRHGMNPKRELKLIASYYKVLKELKPDLVLTYTIKPNCYAGMVCRFLKIPYVANITGLGTAVENGGLMQKFALMLHRVGLKKAQKVFFQNTENRDFMLKKGVISGAYDLLPGSGVNLQRFTPLEYPGEETTEFIFISRIMKEKGIDQYLDAAEYITKKYPNTKFHICGFCEAEYEGRLEECQASGAVIYHGMVSNVRDYIARTHCTVHPTYYPEGLSNVLLESSACARPIITTDRSGCREVIDAGVNGFVVRQKDSEDLIEKIEKFLSLSWEERKAMGLAGRAKVEREFDRQIVVGKYVAELNACQEKNYEK